MKGEESDFPMMNVDQVTLSNVEVQNMRKELKEDPFKLTYTNLKPKEQAKPINEDLLSRYEFSKYEYDINRHCYTESKRIIALLFRFIMNTRRCIKDKIGFHQREYQPVETLVISEKEMNAARMYLFKKATQEVKHFVKLALYKDISEEVDGILTYTGRILPTDSIKIVGKATQVMKDLTSTMFCVPLVEKNSPIAFSIASDIHWNHPTAMHCGIDTVWRYVLQHAYIIEGKSLVTKIGKSCERCRYLNKRSFEMAMGPVSPHNLNIAPAFYVSQTDIVGHCFGKAHLT